MAPDPEAYFPAGYRHARRNFIAAAQTAHVEVVSRVHPTVKGPDGKPLFQDSAALGPRNARRALLLISQDRLGSGVQGGLLRRILHLPPTVRLVMVHARDPVAFAFGRARPGDDWPAQALGAVVTEDLARVERLQVIALEGAPGSDGVREAALDITLAGWAPTSWPPRAAVTTTALTAGTGTVNWKQTCFAPLATSVAAAIAAL